MKRTIAVFLALLLLLTLLPVAALAEESDGGVGETSSSIEEPTPSPTAAPTPVPTAEPTPEVQRPVKLQIDNQNVYEDMEKSYSQGYVPTVKKDTALVILPLLCDGELARNTLRAKANLGDTSGSFVTKNYEKNVELSDNKVDNGKRKVSGYLVSFSLQLKAERVNGSYPVGISVTGSDRNGNTVQEEYTVYVTISDGKDPNATPSPEPTPVPEKATAFHIDNQNIYENMAKSYSQGYSPSIAGGNAVVVLPLLCNTELENNSLRASATLDTSSMSPFASKNYEKTVLLSENKINGGKAKVKSYLVSFALQLKSDRTNGSYPVTITVTADDKKGETVRADFTVYVSITDGKDPNAEPEQPAPQEDTVILGPKVLVQSYEAVSLEEDAQPGVINAGDKMQVRITLVNTSQTENLENMAVTAQSPGDSFVLNSATDSTYIGGLAAGGTVDVTYEYTVKPETPAGQVEFPVSYDFAYDKGMTGSGSGSARVLIRQPLELEFALMQMPAEAVISDTVEVQVQAINLSHAKAVNVRATIEGDGLLPSGTAFIGDLEGGTSQQTPLQIQITGLTQGNYPYGETTGTITYLYEDGDGNEFSEEKTFSVNIKSPFSESQQQAEDDPGQWWIIMAAIGAGILGFGAFFAARFIRRGRTS